MDFETAIFYRDHFDVVKYWASAAVIGGLVPVAAFITAMFWWLKCQHLWSANEQRNRDFQMGPVHADLAHADLAWLR
jgi:hypothetical protein